MLNTKIEKPKIVHILDDGTRLESIEGVEVPPGHPFYTAWRKAVAASIKEEKK